ncbi:MAG: DUF2723 domain-containing protein [candidate division KSB1 bacterium]|jgi:hypothetical protein|nr:DUF2723 domain-containing protein [candidate division KSB1 bacterium]
MKNSGLYNRLIAASVFLFALTVYSVTIAPTTLFRNCGEYIASSYTLGIPHPPGAPLYMLFGRFFSMLPFAQSVGLRVNIISTLSAALTVMLTYMIIVRLIILWRGSVRTGTDRLMTFGAGFSGALALAFSDAFWFNAVQADVYAISLAMATFSIWIILKWQEDADQPGNERFLLLIAYLAGLSIGAHPYTFAILPALFLLYYFRRYQLRPGSLALYVIGTGLLVPFIYTAVVRWLPLMAQYLTPWTFLFIPAILIIGILGSLRRNMGKTFLVSSSLFLILLGASTFSMLYIRSGMNPAFDAKNPETIESFVNYIHGEKAEDGSFSVLRMASEKIRSEGAYLKSFISSFTGRSFRHRADILAVLPLLIGVFGMIYHFLKDRLHALFVLILFLMTSLAIVLFLNPAYLKDDTLDIAHIGGRFAFSLWTGIGASGIISLVNDKFRSTSSAKVFSRMRLFVIFCVIALVPVNMLAGNYHRNNLSGNYAAYDFAYNLLHSCDKNAILFTNDDNDTYPLLYLQHVENVRMDVRVVNLGLLNEPWYIKQLKYREPAVPMPFSEAEIDNLILKRWLEVKTITIPVSDEKFQRDLDDLGERKNLILPKEKPEISFALGPTYDNSAIRVQDLMILNIIFSNKFEKPVYFAVTVFPENMLNLTDYLRLDGLCYKLVTYPGGLISADILKENLTEIYQYRNLDAPRVFYDAHTLGLLRNYKSAFERLIDYYEQEKMAEEMKETQAKMADVLPGVIVK